jgi:hypothetical protein
MVSYKCLGVQVALLGASGLPIALLCHAKLKVQLKIKIIFAKSRWLPIVRLTGANLFRPFAPSPAACPSPRPRNFEHTGTVGDVKQFLKQQNIPVRL